MLSPEQRAELVARMRRGREGNVPGRIGRRGDRAVPPPASFSQEQLWFLDRFAPGQATYTIPVVLRLSGALDRPALERALDRLVERHEVLRTRLILTEDPCHAEEKASILTPFLPPSTDLPPKTGLVQVIAGAGRPVLEEADLSGFAAGKREDALREFVLREALRPFDLAAGPLLRTCLVLLGEAEQALVVVVHHAVFDGWSAEVLVRDLAALYGGEATGGPPGLGELAVQFADYAVWERDSLRGQRRADLESYWRGVLAGFETVQFPADRPRPLVDGPAGALAERLIGPGLLAGLGELS